MLLRDRLRPRPRRGMLRTASTATRRTRRRACCSRPAATPTTTPAPSRRAPTPRRSRRRTPTSSSPPTTRRSRAPRRCATSIDALPRQAERRRGSTRRARPGSSARDDYIVTEPFRFYGGPIDDPKDGPEGQINAWPMDEAYVDYVAGNPNAGHRQRHEGLPEDHGGRHRRGQRAGRRDEHLDGLARDRVPALGPGSLEDRPRRRGRRPTTRRARNADRRARLPAPDDRAAARRPRRASATSGRRDGGAFRTSFLADPDRALRRIMRGIGALAVGELAGERMAVAFESKDQEDEHSCFSDNTNADVVNDIKGIRMVYEADFPGVVGTEPAAASSRTRDPALAAKLRGADRRRRSRKAQAFPATFETMIAAADGSAERDGDGGRHRRRSRTSARRSARRPTSSTSRSGFEV